MTALDNAPTYWTRTTIGEIADVRLGRQRSPKDASGPQMRRYLRAANVGWYRLRLDDVQEMNFTDDEMDTYRVRDGDILVVEGSGSAGEVGKCAIYRGQAGEVAFQNTLIRIRPHDGVDPRWLMYRINAEAELGGFLRLARGVGIFHLGAKRTAQWPIAVPPLDEQRRIVTTIEATFTRLQRLDLSLPITLQRLEVLRDAVLHGAVSGELEGPQGTPMSLPELLAERRQGWEQVAGAQRKYKEPVPPGDLPWDVPAGWTVASLSQLEVGSRSSAYGVLKPGEHVPGGVPFVRVGDLANGTIDDADLKHIAPEVAAAYDRTRLRGGEVLVSLVGTIGRSAVVPSHLAGANVARAIGVFPVAPELAPWIRLVLASPVMRGWLERGANEVARKTLNLNQLRTAPIPLPPSETQGAILQEVDRQLSIIAVLGRRIQGGLDRVAPLRQAILTAAFGGRLPTAGVTAQSVQMIAEENVA